MLRVTETRTMRLHKYNRAWKKEKLSKKQSKKIFVTAER